MCDGSTLSEWGWGWEWEVGLGEDFMNWFLKDEQGFKDRHGQRGNSTWEEKDEERHESVK